MIPLVERICHSMLSGGMGNLGVMPPCIGKSCNQYEMCEFQILSSKRNIQALSKKCKKPRWGEENQS